MPQSNLSNSAFARRTTSASGAFRAPRTAGSAAAPGRGPGERAGPRPGAPAGPKTCRPALPVRVEHLAAAAGAHRQAGLVGGRVAEEAHAAVQEHEVHAARVAAAEAGEVLPLL